MKIAKSLFMLRKLLRDFKTETPLVHTNNSGRLEEYYFVFEHHPKRLNRLIKGFDNQGVPLNGAYIDVENKQLHYYPISIGQYGLALYHSWLKTGEESTKAHFLRIADWFMQNAVTDPQLGAYWLTDVPKPEYDVYSPWKSAFSQSRGISILCRAWQMTGQDAYLTMAAQALTPFRFDIREGGVSVDREQGKCLYEEYVAQWPTRVLDGHSFCLMGLYDFVRVGRGEAQQLAQSLFNEGIEGLIQQLPLYDMGYWLRFNRCDKPGYPVNDPCTLGYLRLVVAQLKLMAQLSGRSELAAFAEKFSQYDRLPNIIRMYREKFKSLRKLNRL